MPEANVLYVVTAVVVLGLAAWVAFVLKAAKEPWTRPDLAQLAQAGPARPPDTPVEPERAEQEAGEPKREIASKGAEASEEGEVPERKDAEG